MRTATDTMPTTFAALVHGDRFKFVDLPDPTTYTKVDAFGFTAGTGISKAGRHGLTTPKMTRVMPVGSAWIH